MFRKLELSHGQFSDDSVRMIINQFPNLEGIRLWMNGLTPRRFVALTQARLKFIQFAAIPIVEREPVVDLQHAYSELHDSTAFLHVEWSGRNVAHFPAARQ